jgi:hypothetical protein
MGQYVGRPFGKRSGGMCRASMCTLRITGGVEMVVRDSAETNDGNAKSF